MLRDALDTILQLDLSYPRHLIGSHFIEILSLLSIVFGGSFLLFAWKHRAYFLGMTGLFIGAWGGLMLRAHFNPEGQIAPMIYLGLGAAAGAYVSVHWQRFVGMMLGGFTTLIVTAIVSPVTMQIDRGGMLTVGMIFLMGGALGALFPKLFFVFNSALIGATFVTYGVTQGLIRSWLEEASAPMTQTAHVAIFFPLLLFGILYQMFDRDGQVVHVVHSGSPQAA